MDGSARTRLPDDLSAFPAKSEHRSKEKERDVDGSARSRPPDDLSASSHRSATSAVKNEGDRKEHRRSKEDQSRKLMDGLEEEMSCPICMSVM